MTQSAPGHLRVERSEKRVRAFLDGHLVVDSATPALVWESRRYPTYYFDLGDLHAELRPTSEVRRSPRRGTGRLLDVVAGDSVAPAAALRFVDSPVPELRDLVRLEWDAMTEWFEEDEVVYTHPRDPYTRVDILASSRRVRVEIGGTVVAESDSPRLLFETGLPTRYYLPLADVRLDLLKPSSSVSYCPYKGTASYLSFATTDVAEPDIAWIYRAPLPESQKIAGLVSFHQERADVYVDNVLQHPSAKRAA